MSWTANPALDGVDHYNVYRSTTAGFPVTPGTTPTIATPTTNSYSNTGLTASTTYYYKLAAVDLVANVGQISSEVNGTTNSVTDITVPTIRITSPVTGSRFPPGNVLVQGTAVDNPGGTGIKDVYIQIDTGKFSISTPSASNDWSTWSKNVTITNLGNHKIVARATDNAGNRKTTSVTITIA